VEGQKSRIIQVRTLQRTTTKLLRHFEAGLCCPCAIRAAPGIEARHCPVHLCHLHVLALVPPVPLFSIFSPHCIRPPRLHKSYDGRAPRLQREAKTLPLQRIQNPYASLSPQRMAYSSHCNGSWLSASECNICRAENELTLLREMAWI